jgi:membrane protease YdiL (CAAX protease family)
MAQTDTAVRLQRATVKPSSAWLSAVAVTVGMLLGIVVALNLVAIAMRLFQPIFPALRTHSPQSLAMLFATGSALGEFLALLVLWRILRRKGDSLQRLGLWKSSPLIGWLSALAVAAFFVVPAVRGYHTGAAHLPVVRILFDPSPFHIYMALVLGCSAGWCEEIFFRGYVMTRLADAGYGKIIQVIASGLFFGLAHSLYALNAGIHAAVDIMLHTALFGGLFAVVYLLSRRSLGPCILGHFLNDSIVLPWVFLRMFHGR